MTRWRVYRDKRGYLYAEQSYTTERGQPRTRRVYLGKRPSLSDEELRAKAAQIANDFDVAESEEEIEAKLRAFLRHMQPQQEGEGEEATVRGLVPALNYLATHTPADPDAARIAEGFRSRIFALIEARARLPHRGDRPPRRGNPALDFWLALDDLLQLMRRHRVSFAVLPRYSQKTGIFLGLRYIVDTTALPKSLTPVAYTLSALFDWLGRGAKPRIAPCDRCSRFFYVTYAHRRVCPECAPA